MKIPAKIHVKGSSVMKTKSIAATGHDHLIPPGFGTHGKNAAQDQVWYQDRNQSVQHYRHLKHRRIHPFKLFIESSAMLLGLSATMVLFMLMGAVMLIFAVMTPVVMEFMNR